MSEMSYFSLKKNLIDFKNSFQVDFLNYHQLNLPLF